MDDPENEGAITVMSCGQLPVYGQPYVFGREKCSWLRAKQITPRQAAGSISTWEVEVQYSTKLDDQGGKDPHFAGKDLQNPLLRPPEISWDGVEYQKELEIDEAGVAVVMPNGQRPSSPLMTARSRGLLRIARNESAFNYRIAAAYSDTTNAKKFWGADPGYCVFKRPKAQAAFENGGVYWRISYEVQFYDEPVNRQILNEGSFYFPGGIGVGEKTLPRDNFGQPSSTNVPLQKNGDLLSDANVAAGNFTYTQFTEFESADWSELKLDYSNLFKAPPPKNPINKIFS